MAAVEQTALSGTNALHTNDNAGIGTWTQQDPMLRDLWAQNMSPEAIAAQLGRSVSAIMTRAARLGLPRRFAPGRKAIVRTAGTPVAARTRIAKTLSREALGDAMAAAKSMRMCLMCTHPFQSHGSHNRICPRCKGSPDYESGSRLGETDFLY